MSVSEAVDKLRPVLFVEGFLNPALEGAKIVNCDFGNVGEEEAKVLDDVSPWCGGTDVPLGGYCCSMPSASVAPDDRRGHV